MSLHMPTLLAVYSLLVCVAALAAVVALGRHGSRAAFHAQCSAVAQALGWCCLMGSGVLAGQPAEPWLASVAQLFMSAGLLALLQGVRQWRGRTLLPRQLYGATIAMPLAYLLAYGDYGLRVGLSNSVLALQMGWVAVEALRRGPQGGWRWRSLLSLSMGAVAAVTAVRAMLAMLDSVALAPSFQTVHPINQLTLLVSCGVSLLGLAAVLAAFRDEAEGQLRELAITDGLTQVLNRRAWNERAEVLLADARRYGHPLIVLMIDLDHFKQINDRHGHGVGDKALQLVAAMLREELRSGDLVGRYGGEEFCVMLSHTREAAALTFDQRLRQKLRQRSQAELGFVLEYSAGLSSQRQKDRTLEDLLRRADAALYEAKRAGRNQLVLAP